VEQKSTHGLATDLIGDPNGTKLDGDIYEFAYVRSQTEPAGACFSANGSVLFVNLYSPTQTLAIKRPWPNFRT
jgi:secreted PhoX family phosphatase